MNQTTGAVLLLLLGALLLYMGISAKWAAIWAQLWGEEEAAAMGTATSGGNLEKKSGSLKGAGKISGKVATGKGAMG